MKNCISTIALLTLILSAPKMNAGLSDVIQGINEHRFNASMCFEFGNAFLEIKNHILSCDNNHCGNDHQTLARLARRYKAGMQEHCQPFFESLKKQDALAQKYTTLNALLKS